MQMFRIYIHRFVDRDLAGNYYIEDWLEYISYINDKELSDILESHDTHYIVILKDRLIVNHVRTQKHYVARKRDTAAYVKAMIREDYDYILRAQARYTAKDEVLIPVYIKNGILDQASDIERMYHLYGMFSLMHRKTEVKYVDNFSKDYEDECLSTSSKRVIIQDERYNMLKIVNVKDKSVIECDYRIIDNMDVVEAIRDDEDIDIAYLIRDVEMFYVYAIKDFDAEMLYAHLTVDYNVYMGIKQFEPYRTLENVYAQENLGDQVWALAIPGVYKFAQFVSGHVNVLVMPETDFAKAIINFIVRARNLEDYV